MSDLLFSSIVFSPLDLDSCIEFVNKVKSDFETLRTITRNQLVDVIRIYNLCKCIIEEVGRKRRINEDWDKLQKLYGLSLEFVGDIIPSTDNVMKQFRDYNVDYYREVYLDYKVAKEKVFDILNKWNDYIKNYSEKRKFISNGEDSLKKMRSESAVDDSSQINSSVGKMSENMNVVDDASGENEIAQMVGNKTKRYDSEGFAIPNLRWKKSGSAYNKNLMNYLKQNDIRRYKTLKYRAWDRKNFPGNTYGKAYYKRGTPENIERFGRTWGDANERQKALRKELGYRGYGAYWGQVLGGAAGRFIGDKIGVGSAGAAIGSKIGDIGSDYIENKLKGYFGSGAYEDANVLSSGGIGNLGSVVSMNTSSNSLINNRMPTRSLSTGLDESNSICITHTEFIMDVKPTSSEFQSIAFLAINPGLSSSFPWLSNIAQFYEEYQFEQLVFTFKSMITEGNASATGSVIMATQYNPANPEFSNKQQMENYDFAQSFKCTADAVHGVECDVSKRGGPAIEYVRVGDAPSGQDVKTFDMATFQIAVSGGFASLNLGELWVSYRVRLGKSKIFTPGTMGRQNIGYAYLNITAGTGNATLSSAAPFGSTAPTVHISGTSTNTNLQGLQISSNTITFPKGVSSGKYSILLHLTQTTVPTSAPIWTVTHGSVSKSLHDETSSAVTPGVYYAEISVAASGSNQCTVSLHGLASMVSSGGELRINQIYSSV